MPSGYGGPSRAARAVLPVAAVVSVLLSAAAIPWSPASTALHGLHGTPDLPRVALTAYLDGDRANLNGIVIDADVLVDAGFIASTDGDPAAQVANVLGGANAILAQVGVRLQERSVSIWRAGSPGLTLQEIVSEASQRGADAAPGRLRILITCDNAGKYDGFSDRGQAIVAVRHYHHDAGEDAAILAHEVGHVLGADHHEHDAECTGSVCLMSAHGLLGQNAICEHHQDVIRATAAGLQSG